MKSSLLSFRDKNPRSITEENLEKLKESLNKDPEFLEKRKMLVNHTKVEEVDKQTKKKTIKDVYTVYAWNQRLKGLLALWFAEIPDNWIDIDEDLSDEIMEERAIKDNIEYGEWDYVQLKNNFTLEQIEQMNLPTQEIDLSVYDEEEEWKDPDEIPQYWANMPIIIKKWDIIQLWDHKIICGDSTDPQTFTQLMDWKRAEMCFTDPPYGMKYEWSVWTHGEKSSTSGHKKIENDDLKWDALHMFLDKFMENIKMHTNGAFYICFYRLGIDWILNSVKRVWLQRRSLICRYKNNHNLSNSDYKSIYEPIVYGWVNEHNFYWETLESDVREVRRTGNKDPMRVTKKWLILKIGESLYKMSWIKAIKKWFGKIIDIEESQTFVTDHSNNTDVWEIEKTQKNDLHPTMKPVQLMVRAILNSSKRGEIILDPFLWSGSTLIASEMTNRICYGVEFDPQYIQTIMIRYNNYSEEKKEIKCLNRKVDIQTILDYVP